MEPVVGSVMGWAAGFVSAPDWRTYLGGAAVLLAAGVVTVSLIRICLGSRHHLKRICRGSIHHLIKICLGSSHHLIRICLGSSHHLIS
jgi:hypothetical protein